LLRRQQRAHAIEALRFSDRNFIRHAQNHAIATYDNNSNLLYSASDHYTLRGDNYTESIEDASGSMARYIGAHPKFRVRIDGDKYYQMGAGKNPGIEEMWQRVGQ
jgi:hypothetical protein